MAWVFVLVKQLHEFELAFDEADHVLGEAALLVGFGEFLFELFFDLFSLFDLLLLVFYFVFEGFDLGVGSHELVDDGCEFVHFVNIGHLVEVAEVVKE